MKIISSQFYRRCLWKFAVNTIAFVFGAYSIFSQQLIQNGSFENHGDVLNIQNYLYWGKYGSVMYNWANIGTGSRPWDIRNIPAKRIDDKQGETHHPFETIQPQDGHTMVEMGYNPQLLVSGPNGWGQWLFAHTTETISVGKYYEISMWLFIPSHENADPDWAGHIGIALLPKKIVLHTPLTPTKNIPRLHIDTVVYDKWYQVSWRVQPLCNAHYLMIGMFMDEQWPRITTYEDSPYYLDNVSMKVLSDTTDQADTSTYYCSAYDIDLPYNQNPLMENLTLQYASGKFDVTPENAALLDSFARYAHQNVELVFEMTGHTDSIGTNNDQLSAARVQAAMNYLQQKHNLPPERFVQQHMADANPVSSNETEDSRKHNRRVTIRQTSIPLTSMYYRLALRAAMDNETKDAFRFIDKWLTRTTNPTNKMLVLFDPRFEHLHSNKGWAYVNQQIKSGYQKLTYPNYAYLFDSLRMDDRLCCGELSVSFNGIISCFPDCGSFKIEIPALPQASIQQKMQERFQQIEPILKKIGWPKKSDVGTSSATSAFFLLQHSLDSATYVRWLPEVKKSCETGDASWMTYAMLYDRCNLIAGKPQRYGTHSVLTEYGEIRRQPCEGDLKTVNFERRKIGLNALPEIINLLPKPGQ